MRRMSFWLLGPASLVVLLAAAGCSFLPDDEQKGEPTANRRPSVRITAGGSTTDSIGVDYKVEFHWHGTDDDGVVALYQYAVDDTITEGAWRDTTGFAAVIRFRATTLDPTDPSHLTGWHRFYIRALDNEFARSTTDTRYFNARTIAPKTRITFPDLSTTRNPQLLRTVSVNWDADDLDSSRPDKKPIWYEYKLVRVPEPFIPDEQVRDSLLSARNMLLDSLRVGDKRGWVRVPNTVREVKLQDLPGESRLVFAVRSVDEAGAVEPAIERNRNFLAFSVRSQAAQPLVRVCEVSQGCWDFPLDGEDWKVTVPADHPLNFKWVGDAADYGSRAGNSTYAIDIPDVERDDLRDPRGVGGWIGWGRWEGVIDPISFPAQGDPNHTIYIKMRDYTDAEESERLCRISIKVVVFTQSQFCLLVDDARFRSNNPPDATHDAYMKSTFLRRWYEMGRVDDYPLWVPSRPGETELHVTRAREISLETFALYQNIIWSVDALGSPQAQGLYLHERENKVRLSTFSGAGGRLLLVGSRITSNLVTVTPQGSLTYPKVPPINDANEDPWPGFDVDEFVWKFMHYRSYIVSIPTFDTGESKKVSGMVTALSLNPAFPDVPLDRTKWNPYDLIGCGQECSFRGGLDAWEGIKAPTRSGIVKEAGLDSLYACDTFDVLYQPNGEPQGLLSGVRGAIVAQRYEATAADTAQGLLQGRLAVLNFQPWYFQPDPVQDAGTSLANWLVTGRDH